MGIYTHTFPVQALEVFYFFLYWNDAAAGGPLDVSLTAIAGLALFFRAAATNVLQHRARPFPATQPGMPAQTPKPAPARMIRNVVGDDVAAYLHLILAAIITTKITMR